MRIVATDPETQSSLCRDMDHPLAIFDLIKFVKHYMPDLGSVTIGEIIIFLSNYSGLEMDIRYGEGEVSLCSMPSLNT